MREITASSAGKESVWPHQEVSPIKAGERMRRETKRSDLFRRLFGLEASSPLRTDLLTAYRTQPLVVAVMPASGVYYAPCQ
jgi:hypothetical protein